MVKITAFFLNLLGWLQIAGGTTLIAALVAYPVYLNWKSPAGRTTALVLIGSGCIAGITWATRIWLKHGTVNWLARLRRTD